MTYEEAKTYVDDKILEALKMTRKVKVWVRGPNPTKYDPTGEDGSRTIEGKAFVLENKDGSLTVEFHGNFTDDVAYFAPPRKENDGSK